ncbi:MAG: hypothetical protein ACOYL1_06325, partial [Chlamydiia bacterium]
MASSSPAPVSTSFSNSVSTKSTIPKLAGKYLLSPLVGFGAAVALNHNQIVPESLRAPAVIAGVATPILGFLAYNYLPRQDNSSSSTSSNDRSWIPSKDGVLCNWVLPHGAAFVLGVCLNHSGVLPESVKGTPTIVASIVAPYVPTIVEGIRSTLPNPMNLFQKKIDRDSFEKKAANTEFDRLVRTYASKKNIYWTEATKTHKIRLFEKEIESFNDEDSENPFDHLSNAAKLLKEIEEHSVPCFDKDEILENLTQMVSYVNKQEAALQKELEDLRVTLRSQVAKGIRISSKSNAPSSRVLNEKTAARSTYESFYKIYSDQNVYSTSGQKQAQRGKIEQLLGLCKAETDPVSRTALSNQMATEFKNLKAHSGPNLANQKSFDNLAQVFAYIGQQQAFIKKELEDLYSNIAPAMGIQLPKPASENVPATSQISKEEEALLSVRNELTKKANSDYKLLVQEYSKEPFWGKEKKEEEIENFKKLHKEHLRQTTLEQVQCLTSKANTLLNNIKV